jgi:uncharacterized protein (DUF305 family)
MKRSFPRMIGAGLLLGLPSAACAAASRAPVRAAVQPSPGDPTVLTRAAQARADTGQRPYTAADAHFMAGMIQHHAQAVLMAGWAPTHGASQSVRALCERIVVGQRDEIALMQRWLRARHVEVPEVDASHAMMPEMDQSTMMPGMLTAQQLAQLDNGRGPEFDRLFLVFMIQHHQGAITMVNQLFGSQGAGEEETVFRFASDVYADQSTEIQRMQKMLATLLFEGRGQ